MQFFSLKIYELAQNEDDRKTFEINIICAFHSSIVSHRS